MNLGIFSEERESCMKCLLDEGGSRRVNTSDETEVVQLMSSPSLNSYYVNPELLIFRIVNATSAKENIIFLKTRSLKSVKKNVVFISDKKKF